MLKFMIVASLAVITVARPQASFGDEKTLPQYIQDLKDADAITRATAFQMIQQKGAEAVPALITAMKDENWKIRDGAVNIVRGLGEQAKEAVPALTALLKDDNGNVRLDALNALEKI